MQKNLKAWLFSSIIISSNALATPAAFTFDPSWMARLRVVTIVPQTSSSSLTAIGGEVTEVSNEVDPELDINYFISQNIAAELVLTASRHSVQASSTALGTISLGHVSLLPPTLLAQYHFLPQEQVNPYVGFGINTAFFYHATPSSLFSSIDYGNSIGPAIQVGTDLALNETWSVNVDLKKMWVKTNIAAYSDLGKMSTSVHVNPWVFGIGLGYHLRG